MEEAIYCWIRDYKSYCYDQMDMFVDAGKKGLRDDQRTSCHLRNGDDASERDSEWALNESALSRDIGCL